MKKVSIDIAIAEAERFLARAKALKVAVATPDGSFMHEGQKVFTYPSAPKEHGALRRASLDLSRSLAEMRKP